VSLALLSGGFALALAAAYRWYGGRIAARVGVDDDRPTPATRLADGVDYVPTRLAYLFPQHFSAIAAAGPIAGPILACQAWGWLPCLLWIGLGVVLIGAVHDFVALGGSVRHDARSIVDIARVRLGRRAGRALLAFIWLALVYVIVAFADITAGTFVAGGQEIGEAPTGTLPPGGAVAAAAVLYLGLSVALGLVQRFLRPPLWLATVVFVPAIGGVVWLGLHLSDWLVLEARTWGLWIVLYCGIASLVPVWALLQPRGYLGGFVLFAALALGAIGVLFGGYEIRQPALRAWEAGEIVRPLLPFLFVTIACGACSGFHGLVCAGTTAKQVARESDLRPLGYGAMLAEGLVALIALVTIMIVAGDAVRGVAPGTVYGNGIGEFLALVIGHEHLDFAVTFGAMAFSTFVFDTLDVCARLGRYILQELFGWRGVRGAAVATLLTLGVPALLVAAGGGGAWIRFWTLFGASNQLLAALTLLVLTVWLRQEGRPHLFTALPMLFVLGITLWALVALALAEFRATHGFDLALANGLVASALVGLALYLLARAVASQAKAAPTAPREASERP
jgi:carbon starvation protein